MPQALTILAQLERLGPEYDTGWTHFSINLSAVFAELPTDRALVERYLRHWTWNWSVLRLRGINRTTGQSSPLGDAVLIQQHSTDPIQMVNVGYDSTTPYATTLENKFKAFLDKGGDTFDGSPFCLPMNATGEAVFEEEVDGNEDAVLPAMKWHSVISQEWNLPQPLPLSLKLCAYFRISHDKLQEWRAQGITALVAAPIFTDELLSQASPASPAGNSPLNGTTVLFDTEGNGNLAHLAWQYVAATGTDPLPFGLVARMNACSIEDSALDTGEAIINLRTRYVKAQPMEENWLPRLSEMLTDGFDLPALLLSQVRVLDQQDPLTEPLTKAFVCSLHDYVHIGHLPAPDGKSLADYVVWKFYKGSQPADFVSRLHTALEAYRLSYAGWIALLRSAGLLAPDTEPATSPVEILDALYTAITEPAAVIELLRQQWTAALATDAVLLAFWKEKEQEITADWETIPLRRILAGAISTIPWKTLPAPGQAKDALDEPHEVIDYIKAALSVHVRERFNTTPADPVYQSFYPVAGNVTADAGLTAAIAFMATKAVDRHLTESDSSYALQPETLTFLTDRIQKDADTTMDDQQDLVRQVAGSVVILRKKGGQWRCLNYVALSGVTHELVAALPYGYVNDMRQSVVEYSNQPLVSEQALLHEAGIADEVDTAKPGFTEDAALVYNNPYAHPADFPNARLVPLQYGQVYEALVCALSTAGAMPREIVQQHTAFPAAIPWKFNPAFTTLPAAGFVHEKKFARKTRIGSLTILQEADHAKLLHLPEKVTPIARAFFPDMTDTTDNTPLLLLPGHTNQAAWTPAFGQRTNYQFRILPPSVTDKVWERWTAADPQVWPAALRLQVLAAWNELHDQDDHMPTSLKRKRHTIDDPAVSHLQLELKQLWPTAGGQSLVRQLSFPVPNRTAAGLAAVQSAGITVTVRTTTSHTLVANVDEATNSLVIQVPEAQVWQASFHPIVSSAADQKRFAPGRIDNQGIPLQPATESGTILQDKGYNLLVEVATPFANDLILPDRLHAALQLNDGNILQRTEQDIAVALKPTGDPVFWSLVHRAEVLVQRWRWDGRPLTHQGTGTGFPTDMINANPATLDQSLQDCDSVLYRGREEDDHLVTPAAADLLTRDRSLPVAQLCKHPLGPDKGVLYFRFGIRVYNRYEGLLQQLSEVDSRTQTSGPLLTRNRWKRSMVLCRFMGDVPAPVVRFAIPLTRAAGKADNMPGVLIVLDEPGYSGAYGFAESLEADFMRATTPVAGKEVLEIGPDPILQKVVNREEVDVTDMRGIDTVHPLEGPVGYSFDTNTDAPRFTRSSFVWKLPAANVPQAVDDDYSFYFIKTRFRRKIEKDLHALGNNQQYHDNSFTSPWTEPRWLRILPPGNRIRYLQEGKISWLDTTDLVFAKNDDAFRFANHARNTWYESAAFQNTWTDPGSRLKCKFFLLLTRNIPDALGKQDSEAYLRIIPLDLVAQHTSVVMNADTVRLVELAYDHKTAFSGNQPFNPLTATEEQVFNALIPVPAATSADAKTATSVAMITRVSPPIPVIK